jgi:hypothetical protein
MARSDKRKEENRRNFDDPLWIGSSGLVHVFSSIRLFVILIQTTRATGARDQAKLYVCVFVEKRKITRKCLFRFFFSYFMRICLSFPCLALLGCFLFLSRFG